MGYRDLVAELGGDSRALLRIVNIPVQALESEQACISFRAVIRLLEVSAAALDCADFGLQLAQRQDLRILGPIRIIGMNSETVGDALRSMIAHLGFYSSVVQCTLDTWTDPRHPRLIYDVSLSGEPHKRQLSELAIGLMIRHMHTLTDGHFSPSGVMFRHGPQSSAQSYRRYLGVRPHFGTSLNALLVLAADLSRPLRNCDPQLRRVFEEYLRSSTANRPLDLRSQVENLLRRGLKNGRVSLRAVAGGLFLHERTLQRRLMRMGVAFEDLVDAARRERCEELLSESRLSMAEIATELSYAKQSSFNRACRRWFGSAPRELKRGMQTV